MEYEINVAKNERHYFATHERSLRTRGEALDMARHFKRLFPESEGYEITLRETRTTGWDVEIGGDE